MTDTREPTETFSAARGRALVFDSGVGGLTVAAELRALCPNVHVDYAADTGFFPYGDKSDEALRARLPDVAAALVEAVRPDVFVIACNTASTLALPDVRLRLSIPVVGTVPAIKPAVALSRSGVIGLLATPGTIRRAYTADLIASFAGSARVLLHGSLPLVALAEAAARGERAALSEFAAAQAPLFETEHGDQMDTIVLACTHFPLVLGELAASAPRSVTYVDSGAAIARQTARLLMASGSAGAPQRPAAYITDAVGPRASLAATFKRFGFEPTLAVTIPDAGHAICAETR